MEANTALEKPGSQEAPKKPVATTEVNKPVGKQEKKLAEAIDEERRKTVPNPDKILAKVSREKQQGTGLKVDLSQENLARVKALREPSRVGRGPYAEGLVNSHHKDLSTIPEHVQAQITAYEALREKIEQGLVDPSEIGTELVERLGVESELGQIPETYEQIPLQVDQELQTFIEKSFIVEHEAEVIRAEIAEFSKLYREAYPQASIEQVYTLARDNARKLVYQTDRDKLVFVGSDHGTKHILEGNMRMASQMIASLENQGFQVTAKDKVLTHQTIIDHDCGYTCGCVQAPKGFEASKDHPIFSAKFIEGNKDYYVSMFGQDGYEVIFDSVLNHSYPTELPTQFQTADVHPELVRSVTSMVDSLGVTAETKTPLFFTSPESIRVLLKIKIASETLGADGVLQPELMARYQEELIEIARAEPNDRRREGYIHSVKEFFNEYTAEVTLGHYAGVVESVGIAQTEDGRLVPDIQMKLSRIHALLGNMFGGKLETQAFAKAMGDFGVDSKELDGFARQLQEARKSGRPTEVLRYSSQSATFGISGFTEDQEVYQEVGAIMEEVQALTIRAEINSLLAEVAETDEISIGTVSEIQAKFISQISAVTTPQEIEQLLELTEDLKSQELSGKIGSQDQQTTKAQEAALRLRRFLTANEKKFLGIT